jgi:hypothetical protein
MFSGLAIFFSFAVLFGLERKYSIVEMIVLWLGTLVLVRFGAKELFFRFSYHRGVWHSLLALVLCSFVTALVFYRLLGRDGAVAWLAASFMGIGYLTHLILDEIYSVDVMDTRIKSSFGTALKLFDYRHLGHSAVMAAAVALVFMVTPPARVFLENITSRSLWVALNQRLLPHDRWFNGMAWLLDSYSHAKTNAAPSRTSPIATGSIAPPLQVAPGAGKEH